ncbi:MAG: flagellar basal body L-ring protein FlgH [Candidatus Marinimicrobia bacterium]|nr:flagellar basal body L-ring protein FlgH [Candidatus Neomarinimicrobiota bacterium]
MGNFNNLFAGMARLPWLLIFVMTSAAACANTHRAIDPKSTVIPEKLYESKREVSDGGIWPGDTSKNLFFEDTKARQVGDIVTVVINETASSSQSATTDTSKNSNINLTTTGVLGLPSNFNIQNFLGMGTAFNPNLQASTSRALQGSGTTTRTGTLTATLSAVIVKAYANGNFEIEGKRSVTVNNEEQLMILRGTIVSFQIIKHECRYTLYLKNLWFKSINQERSILLPW